MSGWTRRAWKLGRPAQRSLLRLAPRAAALALAVGVCWVLYIQYCDLIFNCGCQPLWAGAAEHCNVHHEAPPHCPWCVDGGAYGRWSFAGITVAQLALAAWPGRFGLKRVAALFLAFPVVGLAAGLAAGIATGYWQ